MNHFIKPLCICTLFILMIVVNCNFNHTKEEEKEALINKIFEEIEKRVDKNKIINDVLIPEAQIGRGQSGIVWRGMNC